MLFSVKPQHESAIGIHMSPFLNFGWSKVIIWLPWWLSGKNLPANAGNMGSIPGSVRSPGGGNWQPTPVFLPEKYCDRGA